MSKQGCCPFCGLSIRLLVQHAKRKSRRKPRKPKASSVSLHVKFNGSRHK